VRTCRPSLLTCLAAAALAAAPAVPAGGIAAPARVAAPPAGVTRAAATPARPWHFGFKPLSLRELVNLSRPLRPTSLLPEGWEPSATSSYTGELHRTTIDLGLRRQFAGRSSAQVGARITVLDCISIDNTGRFALGDSGSKIHGLIGFTYRY
jgi:hypothetical protein